MNYLNMLYKPDHIGILITLNHYLVRAEVGLADQDSLKYKQFLLNSILILHIYCGRKIIKLINGG